MATVAKLESFWADPGTTVKMGDRVRWKDSQKRRDIHCLRDEGQRKHNEKRDMKMFMNEKARDRERMQRTHTRKWWREKRILKRFSMQQKLGQKKRTPAR